MLQIASNQTERLVRLVNDILDLERLESSQVTIIKQWCDAEVLMRKSAEAVLSVAAENQINLSVLPSSAKVWADPDRIVQMLVNLLSNAIKFSPSGCTVTVRVEDLGDSLRDSYASRVLFEVKDRGRGIPADQLETIFGRFQQVDASDSRQKGGTGLGLAICRSIVQQHGGRIGPKVLFLKAAVSISRCLDRLKAKGKKLANNLGKKRQYQGKTPSNRSNFLAKITQLC